MRSIEVDTADKGHVVGISLECRLVPGFIILRVITRTAGKLLAEQIRAKGQAVTVFRGQGMRGPVDEPYNTCRRRELQRILDIVKAEDPLAPMQYHLGYVHIRIFFLTEDDLY